jgi:hypothetical protein
MPVAEPMRSVRFLARRPQMGNERAASPGQESAYLRRQSECPQRQESRVYEPSQRLSGQRKCTSWCFIPNGPLVAGFGTRTQ